MARDAHNIVSIFISDWTVLNGSVCMLLFAATGLVRLLFTPKRILFTLPPPPPTDFNLQPSLLLCLTQNLEKESVIR